jgi:hypothetical protein
MMSKLFVKRQRFIESQWYENEGYYEKASSTNHAISFGSKGLVLKKISRVKMEKAKKKVGYRDIARKTTFV